MKKINSTLMSQIESVVTNVSELSPINASIKGQILPVGSKFQFCGIANFKKTDRLPAYQGVIVELESGIQVPLSVRTLNGIYFAFDSVSKQNERKEVETPLSKSGKNIFDFIQDNKDITFEIKEPLTYNTIPFGQTDVKVRSLTQYDIASKK